MKCKGSYPQLPHMGEDRKAESILYYFKKWISNKRKEQMIEKLTENEVACLSQTILLYSFFDNAELQIEIANDGEHIQLLSQINKTMLMTEA